MQIGQLVKKYRLHRKMSMNELARRADVGQSGISEIEAGKRQPTFDVLEKIVKALNLTWAEFFEEKAAEIPSYIRELNGTISELDEEQINLLNEFIKSITKKPATVADLHKKNIKFKKDASEDPVAKMPYWHMRLTALRQERELSLEEAAEQMGHFMTPEILRSYEKGKVVPDPADQELLSDFYETNWFFISGRVNVRWGYAGETTVAIDCADNEDHPNEPLSYEKRKQLRDIYARFDLVYDLEEEDEENPKK